ncbi:hypothetical protein G6F62_015459 [Rhizopus arrhizus]|nr:hypothetical protein G6F62_015459 [Rhizopus arrhizus]
MHAGRCRAGQYLPHLRPRRCRPRGGRARAALGGTHPRSAGRRRLPSALPAGAESAGRATGTVRGLPAPGAQRRAAEPDRVPGHCRGARAAGRHQPLGGFAGHRGAGPTCAR